MNKFFDCLMSCYFSILTISACPNAIQFQTLVGMCHKNEICSLFRNTQLELNITMFSNEAADHAGKTRDVPKTPNRL